MWKLFLFGVWFITCQNIVNSSHRNTCENGHGKRIANCSGLRLQWIPQHIENVTEELYLNDNNISTLPSKVFQHLKELQVLDLSGNKIGFIHEKAFFGLRKLSVLNLENNKITQASIQHGSFSYLESLQTLNIRSNPYWTYHMDADRDICQIKSLEWLVIDVLDKIKFSKKWGTFKKLKRLDIAINHAHSSTSLNWNFTVQNDSFHVFSNSRLEEISLQVSYIERQALCPLTELKTVRLHVRTEQDISVDIFKPFHCFQNKKMKRIEVTGMSYKNSFVLSGHNLKYLKDICLKELVLSHNFIRDVAARYFDFFAENADCLELLDLSNNPFYGSLPWVYGLFRFRNLKVFKISSIGSVEGMYSPGPKHNNIMYSVVLQNSLREIDITNIKTASALPTLNITGGHSLNILNASYFTFSSCDSSLYGLKSIQILDMSGWRCVDINPILLENLPNLVKYVARNSYLGIGFQHRKNNNIFFKNNLNIQFIDLSNNGIRYLPPDMFFSQQNSLTNLILQNNSLTEVPVYIDQFPKLLVLDISFNNVQEFSEQDMQKLGNKRNTLIRLRGNPFHCMCKNLKFLRWANTSGIKDFAISTCLSDAGTGVRMTSIISDIDKFEKNCKSKGWMIFAISLSSVILIVVVLAVVYYRYRYTMEYLFIRIRLKLRKYKTIVNADEYPFDAFISHSHNDIDFIMPMYRKLTSMDFNIALDAKDFIPGRLIAENVVDTLEKSKKMIFVITRNFLESQWGFYELEMTRMYAYREDRQHMVIVIIKDGLEVQNMPSVLREMWSKITCIEWPGEDTIDSTETFYDSISLALKN